MTARLHPGRAAAPSTSMVGGVLAALALLTCLLLAPVARAEDLVTPQARAAAAEWLAYAPAPAAPAAVCLVDTGADLNPDTKGALVERIALDGGSGADADRHGTLMSMIMAAPRNGWGMVGVWPAVRVVSVRAIGEDYYLTGISRCRDVAAAYSIRVILLAGGVEGTYAQTDPRLENAVQAAHARGINVVAAAGNHPGPLDHPANHLPVLAVSASDQTGTLCGFAVSGLGLDLLAPGCQLQLAHPQSGEAGTAAGTSQAAAFVAATLAALRSYRPDLDVAEAEAFLRELGTLTLRAASTMRGARTQALLAASSRASLARPRPD